MTTQSPTTDKDASMMADRLTRIERQLDRMETSRVAQQLYLSFILGIATVTITILIAYAIAQLLVG